MRLLPALLFLVATAAQAKECDLPYIDNDLKRPLRGVIEFAKCIQQRVRDLEAENEALRGELAEMRKTIAGFPGELVNTNGRETRLGGERLDRASYVLRARSTEGATSVAIDDKVLSALCPQGCSVSLQVTVEDIRGTSTTKPGALGPCTFRYDAKSGAWSLSGCGDAVSGVDGNGKPAGDGGGEIILSTGDSCVLADAEPSRSVDEKALSAGISLGRDRARVLYLIAASSQAAATSERFNCELKIAR